MSERPQSLGEKIANSVSHGVALVAAIAGTVLKTFDRLLHPWLSTGLYLVMGWLVLNYAA